MERILANPKIRRLFYTLFLAILLLLIIGKYLLRNISYFDSVVNDLIASIVSTVLIGTFAFYIFPKAEDLDIKVIEPLRIQTELANGRSSTNYWYFSGGTGIFTKAVTLPELARLARETNRPMNIQLQLIDPLDQHTCYCYAEYRRGLKTATGNPDLWNDKYVRNQSLATIVKSVVLSAQDPLVDIEIRLKNNFSLFRMDLCASRVIVTKEDPRDVAFVFYHDSSSFNSYNHEFRETWRQARTLKKFSPRTRLEDLNNQKTAEILQALELFIDISDQDLSFITDLAKTTKNPYA